MVRDLPSYLARFFLTETRQPLDGAISANCNSYFEQQDKRSATAATETAYAADAAATA